MTLRWYYSVDASTVQEWTDRVRLPTTDDGTAIGVGTHADAGSGWEGDLLVDDPLGTLSRPKGFRRVYAAQDAAPAGTQVVGNWFISNVKVRRLVGHGATGRTYVITMADENSLLSRRKWTGANANRPAETDIVRIRWALTQTELNVLSPDETYIDTTSPVTLDAADLRDSSPEDMMMSIFQRTGKHYWVKYEEAAAVGGAVVSSSVANPTVITTTSAHGLTTGQQIVIAGHAGSTPSINGTHVVTVTGATTYTIPVNVTVGGTGGTSTTVGRYILWYANMNTSPLYVSTVSISNDPAEIDVETSGFIYPLSDDAELDGAVNRLSSGLIVPWTAGRVYVQNTAVGDAYAYVDRVSSPPVPLTTAASATAQATRELAELDEPDDEVTTRLTVQEARLNLVMRGMIVRVHATHFPNHTSVSAKPGWSNNLVSTRVMKRVVNQVGPTTFALDLNLSPIDVSDCPTSTATQTIPPLLNGSESSGVVYGDAAGLLQYLRPGITGIRTPTPFNYGRWHFPEFDLAGVDYAGDCAGNKIRICVVGAGTLVIPMTASGGDDRLTAKLYHYVEGVGDVLDETQGPVADGSTFTFNITTSGGTICSHWVDVERYDGPCGDYQFGYGPVGASWTLIP